MEELQKIARELGFTITKRLDKVLKDQEGNDIPKMVYNLTETHIHTRGPDFDSLEEVSSHLTMLLRLTLDGAWTPYPLLKIGMRLVPTKVWGE